MTAASYTSVFEARRKFLVGLAYRILGSVAEAEDAVHDTYIKWSEADHGQIENPAAWLTTTCTRHCVDLLRAAQKTRMVYVGAWLPEPIHALTDETPESALEMSSSLSMAFLLLLERLAPKERAAYLLHDIFDLSYADIAHALSVQEATCRKLVSRARTNIGRTQVLNVVPMERQEALLTAFQLAITTGDIHQLTELMSEDVELRADGGGKVQTLPVPLTGKKKVLDFIACKLGVYWKGLEWKALDINGMRGALLLQEGRIFATVSFACNAENRLTGVFIVRNPDKLARLVFA
ncbi:RNA polymerase sigma factor SigJ [Pollutimonas harenae]|uniref:RNA polymerase sigma factor SigJ n=1 Tax=Pollutimonas harenae TaxID=657015 RepID=A0A853H0I7_9BURK|nr:RNA polymerase sigma factor SigJ [Pollutimonas harenae]NYT85229.1 RNA polymerase sigma factor SigJ [Pollutimonas harenae]TEA72400.1 sigma-70 family RNA polymerase sigma factor [Pollutimonas harenae]